MSKKLAITAAVVLTAAAAFAQSSSRQQLERGIALWDQRLAKSAIAALEIAARDPATAAEAHEALGRIYLFKGWQQESVFPGWHDEPGMRARAIAELKAAVAADPARASAQEALRTAEQFAAAEAVDPAPPRPEIKALDARLQAVATTAGSNQNSATGSDPKSGADLVAAVVAAVEARARAQADPAPYFAGAQILIDRGEYDRAITLAERGATVSDRFIDENLPAYQMTGKSNGSYARGRALATDLVGWALFQKKDDAGARAKLEEAARLSDGQDFANQFHLGELARAQNDSGRAREYYLNALSLAGGPAPLRQRATQTLTSLQAAAATPPADGWLEAELARRREERRAAALKSMVDRPLPKLALTTVDGKPFDASILKGKVVLLDFFASWCGACRAELPHLKAAFAKYQNDPDVLFLFVSIDEDSKRLQRYLDEMKFPFRVARIDATHAEQTMGFDNVPQTFYLDRAGVVRYQTTGGESHGDSLNRVGWYIDQLKRQSH
jgi:thiol-disulfide isomerase/thioredoxin